MFESLKNALGFGSNSKDKKATSPSSLPASGLSPSSKVSEWASMQGLGFSQRSDGRTGYQMDGKIGGKPWRMEQGKPSRDFIKNSELRARAELGIRDGLAVMVMNRQLKNDLDKRAFALYTDSLQTIADPNLPEEMRWLSIYDEVGWEGLGEAFLNNYAILAEERETAMAWISPELVKLLMSWPDHNPATPKILMILRGKAYLRMQFTEGDIPTMEHATNVFTTACELALSSLK
jgi:hypothetical protein